MEDLPYAMRSKFTDLLLTLHVDKQPLEPLRVPALTRIWDVFQEEDDDMPVKEAVPESLNVLKDFVKDHLIDSKGEQNSYEKHKNGMTLSVLNLARSLVVFGFYRTEDELIEMIDPLITLLDGSHDSTSKSNALVKMLSNDSPAKSAGRGGTSRYEMTESNLTVMNCKNKMCEILGIVMDIQNDIRVTRFLREFNNRLVHQAHEPTTIMKKNTLSKLGLDVDKKGHDMTKRLYDLFETLLKDKKLDLEVLSYADYVCINLDLILYKNEGLLNRAFSLLIRFHSQRRSLLDLLRSAQMLESDQAIDTLKRVEEQLTELRRIAQNSEFWLGQTDRESVVTAKKTVDIFNYLSSLLSMQLDEKFPNEEAWMKGIADNNPFLTVNNNSRRRRGSSFKKEENKASKHSEQDLVEFVNEEIDLETPLPIENEDPIQEYQRMLRNLEAHEIIMTIIKQNSIKGVQNLNLYHKVLKSGYSALIRFVRENKSNQKCLLPYVETVFKDHSTSGLGATQLTGEILRDDPALMQKGYSDFKDRIDAIELTPITAFQKSTQLHYLSVFMQYKDEPIPDTQNAVITELTNKENKNTIYLYNTEEELVEFTVQVNDIGSQIASQLKNTDSSQVEIEIPPQLSYSLELLTVMAVATKGKNAITEVMCQSLLPGPEFVKLYRETKFLYNYKTALVSYFIDAYLDIEKDVPPSLQDDIWEFVGMLIPEFDLYMKRKTDASIFNYYQNPEGSEDSKNNGPEIIFKCLFGKTSLRDLQEYYVCETLLNCIENIFQLRMVIKTDKDELIVRNIIEKLSRTRSFTSRKESKQKIGYIMEIIKKNPQLRQIRDELMEQNEDLNMDVGIPSLGMAKSRSRSQIGSGKKFDALNKKNQVQFADPLTQSQAGKGSFFNKSNSNAMKMANHLKELKLMQQFDEAVEKEFEDLAKSIITLKEKSEIGFGGVCTLKPNDVIEAIVDLTDMDGLQLTIDQIPVALKVLRKIIEVENPVTMRPAAEWTGEEDDPTPEIIRNQNLLESCSACDLVANLIKAEKGDAVTYEALLLGIALLIGGNEKVQNGFWNFMIEDNRFINVLAETLKLHFSRVMEHAEEYNDLTKKLNSMKNKSEDLEQSKNDGYQEELEEMTQYKERLDAKTQPDDEDGLDFTSIKYSTTICIRILRFLQLLCEGHNKKLQDHLREQNNRDGVSLGKNFDFPTYISNIFGIFAKHANSSTMELGIQLVETLIELLQGPCQGNQKVMINAKIIDHCRDFISGYQEEGMEAEMEAKGFDFSDDEQVENINETKKLLVTLLVALLEGIPDHSVITRMSQSLDLELMKERMYYVYKEFVIDLLKVRNTSDEYIANIEISTVNNGLKLDSLEEAILEGFDIFILFQVLSVYSKTISDQLDDSEFTPGQRKAKEFFACHTGRIEVNVDNVIQRTYFPIMPVCKYLNKPMKEHFKFHADRTSPNVKIRSLMDESKRMIMEMEHHAKVDNAKCMISPKIVSRIRDLSTLLAVIINILMLVFMKLDPADKYRTIKFDSNGKLVIDIINGFQLAGAILVIISYVLSQGTLILRHRWETHVATQKVEHADHDEILEEAFESIACTLKELTKKQKRQLLHLEGPYSDKLEDVQGIRGFEYYMISCTFICTDGWFLYYIFYCTISILGLVIHPIWTAFLLIDFAVRFDMLKSITKNKNTLGMTLILILIVLFIYASVGFFFFYDMMYTYEINTYDSDTIGESLCDNMVQCFINVLNHGLRNGGGIGDAIKQDDVIDRIDLFFYMFSFHIIVILIMLNIVFGIIIDTFAQLRDEKRSIEHDQNNKCFICNLDRYIFDQDGNGFEDHTTNDHNMWNYLFYIIHLKMKDPTEYTGVETYCWKKYDKEDISWIPLHKAMVIDNPDDEGEEDEEQLKKKMEELYERLKQVSKRMNKK